MGVALSYGMTQLVARRAAARAANASSYTDALNGMQTEALFLNSTSLAQFCRLQPIGGYAGCGIDLYIKETNIYNNKTYMYGPNVNPVAVDSTNNIYECMAQASYQVTPMIPMSMIPFYSTIVGVGQPYPLSTAWNVSLEHPTLLDQTTTAYNIPIDTHQGGILLGAPPGGIQLPPPPGPFWGGGTGPPPMGFAPIPFNPVVAWTYSPIGNPFSAEAGQTAIGSSPYTASLTNQQFPTGISLVAGQRISLQMLSSPGPSMVSGSIGTPGSGGVTFDISTSALNYTAPVSGTLIFNPSAADGWTGTSYNLQVYVTN